jgi:DNA-binding transcriptional LysR family regulator
MTPNQIRGLDTWPVATARNVRFEFEMLETALLTASAGEAVLFCPKFIVASYNKRLLAEQRLTELEPRGVPSSAQHVYLVIRQNEEETSFSKKLASYLRKLSD